MSGVEVRKLVADMDMFPKDLRGELRRELRKTGARVLSDVRANASWSTRIPRATRMGLAFGGRRPGVFIRVSAIAAPHARALEGLATRGDSFRHPVFGSDRWVSQPTRPFFFRAANANAGRLEQSASRAVDVVARRHGFR